jgi:hypothetical protein
MAKTVIGKHTAFLKAFRKCGSITLAAQAAKVDRTQHYVWLEKREGYREEFNAACREVAQGLEDEAIERATKGVFEPNQYQGEFVYPKKKRVNPETGEEEIVQGKTPLGVWKKSDSLLMFLLKGLNPQRYRDRVSAEVSGPDGKPIPLEDSRLRQLSDEELAQLIAVTKKLTAVVFARSRTETTKPE